MKISIKKFIKEFLNKAHDSVEIISHNNQEVISKIILKDENSTMNKEPTMKEMVKLLLVKVTNLEARMDRLEQRMDRLEERMDRLEERMEKIEKDVNQLKKEAIKHGWNIK